MDGGGSDMFGEDIPGADMSPIAMHNSPAASPAATPATIRSSPQAPSTRRSSTR